LPYRKKKAINFMPNLEQYFRPFRENIVGINQHIQTPYGEKPLVYADWTASGRLYNPIEQRISHDIGAYMANTHTETNLTGSLMTHAYHEAQQIIKKHVNAGPDDILIAAYSGMTGVVNKLQRMLGLRIHEKFHERLHLQPEERPVVFCTHMEHHSNQTSWLETICDLVIIRPDEHGRVDPNNLEAQLQQYQDRPLKIAAITSGSNVTGILTPYHEVAAMMHRHGGYCFVDFACTAPYIDINMHPADPLEQLDAIYFSPHKFLGGPGTSGVLVFNKSLYHNRIPDNPGGGTVLWTNPWGGHHYIEDIEAREDGGTPPILQTIKTALAIRLKEQMGVKNMLEREHELLDILWQETEGLPYVTILERPTKDRLGVVSFTLEGLHYNLAVKMLNDLYGIQVRGGCACAGTYGHFLFDISQERSCEIVNKIDAGDMSEKPGWIRLSLHPTMTDAELRYIIRAIKDIGQNHQQYAGDYVTDYHHGSFRHRKELEMTWMVREWLGMGEPVEMMAEI
jgi:selenocysteine lyase/cysteine desulfurase